MPRELMDSPEDTKSSGVRNCASSNGRLREKDDQHNHHVDVSSTNKEQNKHHHDEQPMDHHQTSYKTNFTTSTTNNDDTPPLVSHLDKSSGPSASTPSSSSNEKELPPPPIMKNDHSSSSLVQRDCSTTAKDMVLVTNHNDQQPSSSLSLSQDVIQSTKDDTSTTSITDENNTRTNAKVPMTTPDRNRTTTNTTTGIIQKTSTGGTLTSPIALLPSSTTKYTTSIQTPSPSTKMSKNSAKTPATPSSCSKNITLKQESDVGDEDEEHCTPSSRIVQLTKSPGSATTLAFLKKKKSSLSPSSTTATRQMHSSGSDTNDRSNAKKTCFVCCEPMLRTFQDIYQSLYSTDETKPNGIEQQQEEGVLPANDDSNDRCLYKCHVHPISVRMVAQEQHHLHNTMYDNDDGAEQTTTTTTPATMIPPPQLPCCALCTNLSCSIEQEVLDMESAKRKYVRKQERLKHENSDTTTTLKEEEEQEDWNVNGCCLCGRHLRDEEDDDGEESVNNTHTYRENEACYQRALTLEEKGMYFSDDDDDDEDVRIKINSDPTTSKQKQPKNPLFLCDGCPRSFCRDCLLKWNDHVVVDKSSSQKARDTCINTITPNDLTNGGQRSVEKGSSEGVAWTLPLDDNTDPTSSSNTKTSSTTSEEEEATTLQPSLPSVWKCMVCCQNQRHKEEEEQTQKKKTSAAAAAASSSSFSPLQEDGAGATSHKKEGDKQDNDETMMEVSTTTGHQPQEHETSVSSSTLMLLDEEDWNELSTEALVELLSAYEDDLALTYQQLEYSSLETLFHDICQEVSSQEASHEVIGVRKQLEDHCVRLQEEIPTLQDQLKRREQVHPTITLEGFYKQRLDEETKQQQEGIALHSDNPNFEQESRRQAEEELVQRDRAMGLTSTNTKGATGYKPRHPGVYGIDFLKPPKQKKSHKKPKGDDDDDNDSSSSSTTSSSSSEDEHDWLDNDDSSNSNEDAYEVDDLQSLSEAIEKVEHSVKVGNNTSLWGADIDDQLAVDGTTNNNGDDAMKRIIQKKFQKALKDENRIWKQKKKDAIKAERAAAVARTTGRNSSSSARSSARSTTTNNGNGGDTEDGVNHKDSTTTTTLRRKPRRKLVPRLVKRPRKPPLQSKIKANANAVKPPQCTSTEQPRTKWFEEDEDDNDDDDLSEEEKDPNSTNHDDDKIYSNIRRKKGGPRIRRVARSGATASALTSTSSYLTSHILQLDHHRRRTNKQRRQQSRNMEHHDDGKLNDPNSNKGPKKAKKRATLIHLRGNNSSSPRPPPHPDLLAVSTATMEGADATTIWTQDEIQRHNAIVQSQTFYDEGEDHGDNDDECFTLFTPLGRQGKGGGSTNNNNGSNDDNNKHDSNNNDDDDSDIIEIVDDDPTSNKRRRIVSPILEHDVKVPVRVCSQISRHLKQHQREGIQFMWTNICGIPQATIDLKFARDILHGSIKGCILAHNMGLGKSLQTVAFLHTLLCHPGLIFPGSESEEEEQQETSTNGNDNSNSNNIDESTHEVTNNLKQDSSTSIDETKDKPSSKHFYGISKNRLIQRVVLCVPKNVLSNWEEEFKKWTGSLDFRVPLVPIPSSNTEDGLSTATIPKIPLHCPGKFTNMIQRIHIVRQWYNHGGVLLLTFDLFRALAGYGQEYLDCMNLVSKDDDNNNSYNSNGTGDHNKKSSNNNSQKKSSKKRSAKLMEQDETIQNQHASFLAQALLDPGPDVCVIDEAHEALKNRETKKSKAFMSMVGVKRRIGLTGTPFQNNLQEYYTMANWARPKCLGKPNEFDDTFVIPIQQGLNSDSSPDQVQYQEYLTTRLYRLLEPFVHRRDSNVLANELPIMQQAVIVVRQSKLQGMLYRQFKKCQTESNSRNIFEAFGKMRLVFNHPAILLMTDRGKTIDLESMKKKQQEEEDGDGTNLKQPQPNKKKQQLLLESHEVLPKANNHNKTSRMLTNEKPQISNANKFSSLNQATTLKLHGAEALFEQASSAATASRNDADVAAAAKDDDIIELLDSEDDEMMADENVIEQDVLPSQPRPRKRSKRNSTDFNSKNNIDPLWWVPVMVKEKRNVYDLHHGGKMVLLLQILTHSHVIGDKVVVFSQSLDTLNFIEHVLNTPSWETLVPELTSVLPQGSTIGEWKKNVDYMRIDGAVDAKARGNLVQSFGNCLETGAISKFKVFLLTTKAGGVGINLVAANRVVIFDSSWNPATDLQALYRCYRYGQTKPVYAYRLLAEGTMEEKIYSRQVNKTGLSKRVIDQDNPARHFSERELNNLMEYDLWVQCDECDKWRMLPPTGAFDEDDEEQIPDYWTCSMNIFDPDRSTCDAKERSHRFYLNFYTKGQGYDANDDDDDDGDDDNLSKNKQGNKDGQNTNGDADDANKEAHTARDAVLKQIITLGEEAKKKDEDEAKTNATEQQDEAMSSPSKKKTKLKKKKKKGYRSWISKYHFHDALLLDDKKTTEGPSEPPPRPLPSQSQQRPSYHATTGQSYQNNQLTARGTTSTTLDQIQQLREERQQMLLQQQQQQQLQRQRAEWNLIQQMFSGGGFQGPPYNMGGFPPGGGTGTFPLLGQPQQPRRPRPPPPGEEEVIDLLSSDDDDDDNNNEGEEDGDIDSIVIDEHKEDDDAPTNADGVGDVDIELDQDNEEEEEEDDDDIDISIDDNNNGDSNINGGFDGDISMFL